MKNLWWLLVFTLYWTNPPEKDLNSVWFYGVRQGTVDTLFLGKYPTCERYSLPDSIHVNLGCNKTPSVWNLWCVTYDFNGNHKGISNVVTLHFPCGF